MTMASVDRPVRRTGVVVAGLLLGCAGSVGGCSADDRAVPVDPGAMDAGAPSASSLCSFARPPSGAAAQRAVLAMGVRDELRVLRADGTVFIAHRFGQGAGVGAERIHVHEVLSRGGAIAASARWRPFDASPSVTQELVLLGSDGSVRWQRRIPGGHFVGADLGDGGALSYFESDRTGRVVDPAGQERALPGFSPLGGPRKDGVVAVAPVDFTATSGHGWLAPDGTLLPLALPLWAPSATAWIDDQLLYLGDAGGRATLVLERPGVATYINVEAPAERDRRPAIEVEGRFALITATDGSFRQWRLDADNPGLQPVQAMLPADTRPWQSARPRIDDRGALRMAARDTYRGGIYRGEPGSTLARIGLSVAQTLALDHHGRGGTFVISARTEAFGGETEWPQPLPGAHPDLIGNSVQVARPGDNIAFELPGGVSEVQPYLVISRDGQCVAWNAPGEGGRGGRVRAVEVASRQTIDATTTPAPVDVGPLAWID